MPRSCWTPRWAIDQWRQLHLGGRRRVVPSENLIRWIRSRKENRIMIETDGDLLQTSARIYVGLLRSHERLKAEILILRHQLSAVEAPLGSRARARNLSNICHTETP